MLNAALSRLGAMVRAEGKSWVIPGLVILSLPWVGIAVWIAMAFNFYYGHVSQAGGVVMTGVVCVALGVIALLMVRLMHRWNLRPWHRWFLGVSGILVAMLGSIGVLASGAVAWLGVAVLAGGVLMLMSLLQEQMTRRLESEHGA